MSPKHRDLKAPEHIAVIMDGNGRWARARGLPRAFGHREGAKTLHEVVAAAAGLGIGWLTVYTFSTENWRRPAREVKGLMKLIAERAHAEQAGLLESNARVRVIGRLGDVPPVSRRKLDDLVTTTAACTGLNFTLAISYGGRAEIIDACRRAVESGHPPSDENEFRQLLYDPTIPDPDLLIRTGGDQRISNYLLWQSAYTELYFTETLWPDFHRAELEAAIAEYGRRQRRFGRV
ncbi:MAG TPA: di-trans,poly-cis-decaprenylcistransferase [candidate division WOR-3 bacterium]|uniref:Isoprenyl transferase n=1 Tax=candidate division WOR-3 bacterium TaxID=2052148 RepID=A0A7V0XF65_UNCW3|nr:di-trans,poly-cis-decaprenylcistransferase [candidate division WOR-3 bacterium]